MHQLKQKCKPIKKQLKNILKKNWIHLIHTKKLVKINQTENKINWIQFHHIELNQTELNQNELNSQPPTGNNHN